MFATNLYGKVSSYAWNHFVPDKIGKTNIKTEEVKMLENVPLRSK